MKVGNQLPATMTHQLFAQTIMKTEARFNNISKDMFKVMMLATQGPDPFFFYGMHPFKKREDKKRVQSIGSFLHHHDPANHLEILIQHAFKDTSQYKDTKIYYALGALMHYVLDRHVHAYVFSISGFDKSGQLTYPYNVYHSYCETLIDIALLNKKAQSVKYFHPKNNIDVKINDLIAIQQLYQASYKELVQDNDFIHATQDMITIYKTVYDRFGIKRVLLKTLLGKHSQAFAASHPKKLSKKEKAIDVLNEKGTLWQHPEHNQTYQTSVLQMFDGAISDMKKLLYDLDHNQLDLKTYANNISYDGITIRKKMKFQSLRFPL